MNAMIRKKNQDGFILFGMMALLNAMALASFDDLSNADRKNIISCRSNVSTGISRSLYREMSSMDFNDDTATNNSQPAERKNGNGCSHQSAGSSVCDISGSKRRVLKILTG